MLKIEPKEFWFVVGSQHLYGEETLKKVRDNVTHILETINQNKEIPYPIIFKGIMTTEDDIKKIMKEVNYHDRVAGIITWMHTFSPAKMWIAGTKLLQKPLLHLVTQYQKSIPWKKIDMDYMNLHQSAHGDREYGYINKRLGKNNKILVGHWQDETLKDDIADRKSTRLNSSHVAISYAVFC